MQTTGQNQKMNWKELNSIRKYPCRSAEYRAALQARAEGVKKWSMVNSHLSFVIGGGASRNHFLKMPRRRRIQK
jgi:hypothetical protein